MAAGAAIDQTCADANVCVDVPTTVPDAGSLPLIAREFPLEELAAAPNGAERVATDDEQR
jgi:hypothetical protein